MPLLVGGRIELADAVARIGIVVQGLIAVRETLGNEERAMIVLVELHRDMLQVGRAFGTQVDDDVEDAAASTTHERRLGKSVVMEKALVY